jgi:hypothetical protein
MEADTYILLFPSSQKRERYDLQRDDYISMLLWAYGAKGARNVIEQYQKIGELAGICFSWTVLSTGAG